MSPYAMHPITPEDAARVSSFLRHHWGSPVIITNARQIPADRLPGFLKLEGEEIVGLATYLIEGRSCELVTLNSTREREGVGAALVEQVVAAAATAGCTTLRVVTTNDNLPALRFYQKRGFFLTALRPNAVAVSRGYKPEIPLSGIDGIPIRDELELARDVDPVP